MKRIRLIISIVLLITVAACSSPATPDPTATPTNTQVLSATPTEVPTEVPTSIPTEVSTSTPTEVPTNTPTQVPVATMPEIGKILFFDDFSTSTENWGEFEETDMAGYYNSGYYTMELYKENWVFWNTPGLSIEGDFFAQVTRYYEDGSKSNVQGIICNYQDGDNYYALYLGNDEYAEIILQEAGEWINLFSAYVEGIDPLINDIVVTRIGSELSLYANGNLLASVEDSTYTNGDVGLIIGTWDDPDVVISFDDFLVARPK